MQKPSEYGQFVDTNLATGKTVDKLVHEAVKGYLGALYWRLPCRSIFE